MSSKTLCALGEFQRRIQGALADMSSFVSNTSDVESEQMKSESWDYASYLERVHTYKSTTWFAKPTWMSPIVCSRYGWTNVDDDLLQCVGCRSVFVGRLPASYDPVVYEACRKRLETQISQLAHHPCCVWPGNPTPLSVIDVDGNDESGDPIVLGAYIKRVLGLVKLGTELPVIDPLSVSLSEADVNSLIDLLEQNSFSMDERTETQVVLKSAALLALCGWEASDFSSLPWPQVQCKICNRCNGLWNFITHSSNSKADSDFTPNCESEETEDEDCRSITDECAVGVSDCTSPIIDVAANVDSVSTNLKLTEVVLASVDESSDCSHAPIIRFNDSGFLATDTTRGSSVERCCDSGGSGSSNDVAESETLVGSETTEQIVKANKPCNDDTDNDLCFRHSLADVIETDDKKIRSELTEDECKLEVVTVLNTVVDHICKNEDVGLLDDHMSKQSVQSFMQTEACGSEENSVDDLVVSTSDPVGEENRSMPVQSRDFDLDFEHSVEKLREGDSDIDSDMSDAMQTDSTSGVLRSSIDNMRDTTISNTREANLSCLSCGTTVVDSHVSANVDNVFHGTSSSKSGEVETQSHKDHGELLFGEASALSLLSDNGSQTKRVPSPHPDDDSETTRLA